MPTVAVDARETVIKESSTAAVQRGTPFPLGSTVLGRGVNFSVFAKDAGGIDLLLFDSAEDVRPSLVIPLDSKTNRTDDYWHIYVPELVTGQIYAYRTTGPDNLSPVFLLDPYGKAVAVPRGYDRNKAAKAGDSLCPTPKSVVADLRPYDWDGDAPPRRPFSHTVIYEMHVRGFTQNPNSGVSVRNRGRYAGVIEKIPYLTDLGVTAVELLPVFQFDPQAAPGGLPNYWGYQPLSLFAPHSGFSSESDVFAALNEFRDMVKALHKAGIEVILDVVYNHTAEGDATGPTLCFRGLANDVYYILDSQGHYADHSGCGNTLNANHPVVRRMILDSLRHWVREMHVDGFRFDLASILARGRDGQPLLDPPALWDIETDPYLGGVKLIAEPWDASGLYQVGSFIGDRWMEWNGKFRDDVRRFLRGNDDTVSQFGSRLLASPDIYGNESREAEQSINFITCHDGFTLNDLVSYDRKHNEANADNNRDGADENFSWNCGQEGPTSERDVEKLRNQQVKNFLTASMVSLGTPMILMGDEMRRTQGGNNNAYCQDSEVSWVDWSLLERHADVHRFAKLLIHARLDRFSIASAPELTLTEALQRTRVEWHGTKLHLPDWSRNSHSIALTGNSVGGLFAVHYIFNAYWEPLTFEVPVLDAGTCLPWGRWIDTALDSPEDICMPHQAPAITAPTYVAHPRSAVVLIAAATKVGRNREGGGSAPR